MNTRNWPTIWLAAILALSFEARSVELHGCLDAPPINACETFCVQSVEVKDADDKVESVSIIATNNLAVSADLKLSVSGTNIDPTSAAVESTLASSSSCYVYQGNILNKSAAYTLESEYFYFPGTADISHDDSFLYELPWASGERHIALNNDDDYFEFAMPAGTPVYAARSGTVVGIKHQDDILDNSPEPNHTANEVLILHEDESIGVYQNITQNGVLAEMGDEVAQGEIIAVSGQTGNAINPKLTFYVTTPPESDQTGLININFLTAEGVFGYFTRFEDYTAVHPTIDPDLSFEDGDSEQEEDRGTSSDDSSGSNNDGDSDNTTDFGDPTNGTANSGDNPFSTNSDSSGGGGGSPSLLILFALGALSIRKVRLSAKKGLTAT